MAVQGQIEKAKKIAQSLSDTVNSKGMAMAAIAKAQAQQGDIAGALETAAVASKENPYILGGIFGEQVKLGEVQGARERALAFKEGWLSNYALYGIVSTQIELKDLAGGRTTAELMTAGHAKAMAWKELALAQIQARDVSAARQSVGEALSAAMSMQQS